MRVFRILFFLLLGCSPAFAFSPIQTSFNAGEFSPLMEGHINLEKRADAGLLVQNLIALKQGPLVRRGGTYYVAAVNDSTLRTALIPFEFNTEQAYIIEVSNQKFRFYRNNGLITSGGSPYTLTTVYSGNDVYDDDNILQIDYAQSADVMYLVHELYEPQVLTRTGHASWTISELAFDDGPFLPVNDTTTTLTLSGTTGSVTVTASAVTGINGGDGFQTTDVGRLIRWKDPANNWTWLQITGRTSTTVVTATIRGANASAGTATVNWRLGVYSDTTGWPSKVTFFQNRLVFAGSTEYPDRFDMSESGGYSFTSASMSPSNAAGTVADDNAITGTLQSGRVNKIQWLSSDEKGLLIGTTAQEWVVKPDELNAALTPSNAKADVVSDTGSAGIKPVRADANSVFVQRARRKILDIPYIFEIDSLKPRDISVLAEHITESQLVDLAYQQEPINVVWGVRNDGTLVGLTYYPDQGVFGWHRHIIGGTFNSGQAVVESIAVIPSPDGDRDELWMTVKRTINGATVRYVEFMKPYFEGIDQEDAVVMDSALTYDGSAVNTVTGLDHLEGQTVKVIYDGKATTDLTVSSGDITLPNSLTGSVITAGLGNTWAFKSLQVEGGIKDGTAQGKTKRITGITVRVKDCLGLNYGPSSTNTAEYDFNQGTELDTMTPLYTGDTEFLRWPGGYDKEGQIYLTDDGVFPCAILATMPELRVYDR